MYQGLSRQSRACGCVPECRGCVLTSSVLFLPTCQLVVVLLCRQPGQTIDTYHRYGGVHLGIHYECYSSLVKMLEALSGSELELYLYKYG